MNRYDRQERISGWDQQRLGQAAVLVDGRGRLGSFTVWALASMGVGTVCWLGRPRQEAAALAGWILATPSPYDGCTVREYPFAAEYEADLDWVLGEAAPVRAVVGCADDPVEQALCREVARVRQIPWLAGTTSAGGWFGPDPRPSGPPEGQDPVAALALAALLADAVRETLCPLAGGLLPPEGPLGLHQPPAAVPGGAVLIGVGGIGVYAAAALAALGCNLHLIDFDRVEESNTLLPPPGPGGRLNGVVSAAGGRRLGDRRIPDGASLGGASEGAIDPGARNEGPGSSWLVGHGRVVAAVRGASTMGREGGCGRAGRRGRPRGRQARSGGGEGERCPSSRSYLASC
jgi:hypothetical protein